MMDMKTLGNVATSLREIADYRQLSSIPNNVSEKSAIADAARSPALAPTFDQVKEAVQAINKSIRSPHDVTFSIDADSNRIIIRVIDNETGDVLRQMPTEEALAIAKTLDQVLGKLVRQQA